MAKNSAGRAIAERLRALATVDLRSLGLLRILVGLLLVVDRLDRARFLQAHYGESGILPREALLHYDVVVQSTLHGLASGSPVALGGLFALGIVCAGMLVLGFHTRLATLGSWLLLCDLQWRNPPLNFGGDVMLRMLLFWALFLPWGARFSLDARRRQAGPPADAYVSLAGLALLLQVAFVYWFAVAHRSGPLWWNGQALLTSLHYDYFATSLAGWLRGFPAILPLFTWGALAVEALAPALAFSPIATGPLRVLAAGLVGSVHVGLLLLFSMGIFPLIFLAAWSAFLPAWFWARLPWPSTGGKQAASRHALVEVLAVVALALVFLSNLETLAPAWFARNLPAGWDTPARALRITQRWGLFAPPPIYDGWYVFAGRSRRGPDIDLLDSSTPPGLPSFEKPERVSATLPWRWRRYLLEIPFDAQDPRWTFLGRYLCRDWNERHPDDPVEVVRVHYVRETTTPAGPERGEILTLVHGECDLALE